MQTTPSDKFQHFLDEFLGPVPRYAVQQGFSTHTLHALDSDELKEAEQRLLSALERGTADSRIYMGLGELGTPQAGPMIRRDLDTRHMTGLRLSEAALALWRIEQAPEALVRLANALKTEKFWSTRVHVAALLKYVRCRETLTVLREALDDDQWLVRANAARSMIYLCGLETDATAWPQVALDMKPDDPQERRPALDELLALVDAHHAELPSCRD